MATIKVGDVIAVKATADCRFFIGTFYHVMELWRVVDGRVTSLYRVTETVPARFAKSELEEL
jgi:hypothetical protein